MCFIRDQVSARGFLLTRLRDGRCVEERLSPRNRRLCHKTLDGMLLNAMFRICSPTRMFRLDSSKWQSKISPESVASNEEVTKTLKFPRAEKKLDEIHVERRGKQWRCSSGDCGRHVFDMRSSCSWSISSPVYPINTQNQPGLLSHDQRY